MSQAKLPNNRQAVLLGILINGKKCGREIRDEYEKRTGKAMPVGSLYTTLDRMVDKGFLKSNFGDSTPPRRGNRRKYYQITASGYAAFDTYTAWAASALGVVSNG